MAKFSKKSKLSYKETQQIIMDLCAAIAATHNIKEAAQVLTDLLGKQELEMIARRLKIAELLLKDYTYNEIRNALKASNGAIARIHNWLQESGEGYRLVLERTKHKRDSLNKADKPITLSSMKRKHPMYFWPQIMLEQWVNNSTKKERDQMKEILVKLGSKRKLYAELDKMLVNKE